MKILFGFFLRLFGAFLAAKLLLGVFAADTASRLLGLSLVLVAFSYLFDLLRRSFPASEIGWLVSRTLIRMNVPPWKRPPQDRTPGPPPAPGS